MVPYIRRPLPLFISIRLPCAAAGRSRAGGCDRENRREEEIEKISTTDHALKKRRDGFLVVYGACLYAIGRLDGVAGVVVHGFASVEAPLDRDGGTLAVVVEMASCWRPPELPPQSRRPRGSPWSLVGGEWRRLPLPRLHPRRPNLLLRTGLSAFSLFNAPFDCLGPYFEKFILNKLLLLLAINSPLSCYWQWKRWI